MRIYAQRRKVACLLLLPALCLLAGWVFPTHHQWQYQVHENSQVFISGRTNLNGFSCQLLQPARRGRLLIAEREAQALRFANARFSFRVSQLDCGNSRMNQDMYHTLRADHFPFIHIDLLEVKQAEAQPSGGPAQYLGRLNLQIAGQCSLVEVLICGKEMAPSQYLLEGELPLRMSSFGLSPPSPMMGLIRVKDELLIHFQLYVHLQPDVQSD
ncbi:MAG: hypothetical protein D6730_04985 [Bacteroidetes bacterium]|nr:MAG: hypothetical protein D6730_04985 [Bacteroidota bacterium]